MRQGSAPRNSALGSEPLSRIMPRLALPSILAQVVNVLYNVVDRMYIGHIADAASLALTGLGVCLPVITLVSAFSLFAGAGSSLAAIELGRSERDSSAIGRAEALLGNSFIMLCAFALLLGAGFYAFREPVLRAFGASDATMPYARSYLGAYLAGTLFVLFGMGLNLFVSCQGHARTAMASTLIGAAVNIALDPLLIFVLDMGVRGAAVATVIAQGASAAWVLAFLCSRRSSIVLRPRIIRFNLKVTARISALGISPFVMASTESAVFVVFNSGLQRYGGDLYVGAMTIMQSLMQLVFVPVQGFADGVQPLVGYNYGAQKAGRTRRVIFLMTGISFACTAAFSLVTQVFRVRFASIFTGDAALLSLIDSLMPVYFGAVWIFGIQMGAQRTFVALGRAGTSIFIALLRKVILLIPLALLLPRFFGVGGIFWAEPLASTTSALASLVALLAVLRRL